MSINEHEASFGEWVDSQRNEARAASQAGDAKTQTDPTPRSLEELRVKVAELHTGKKFYHDGLNWYQVFEGDNCPQPFARHEIGIGFLVNVIPLDYPRDLNACAEFRRSLNKKQRVRYAMLLWQYNENQEGTVQWRLLDASATAHCLAFIAVTEGMK